MVDSFGIWDLIYRYLAPGWWIIPVYTTITAWIGTVAWWRRAARVGESWAQRLLLIIDNGPVARRLGLRAAVATPFFLPALLVIFLWYVIGSVAWAEFRPGDGGDQVGLGVNGLNLATMIYACVAVVVIAAVHPDDDLFGWGWALGFSLPFSGFLVLASVLMLVIALLDFLVGLLVGGTDQASDYLRSGLMWVGVALLSVVAFWAAGWTARKGYDLVSGAVSTALTAESPPPARPDGPRSAPPW